MEILRNRMKSLRQEKGLSQSALARAIGTNPNEISRYENGKISPSIPTLVKLAKIFKVTADYLIIENASKLPLRIDDEELLTYIEKIQTLNGKDRESLFHMIDALVGKNKMKAVTQEMT